MEHAISVAATLDLTNEVHRELCDAIRQFHSGRWPVFEHMYDVAIVGDDLVELTKWRGGSFAVVWWSLTRLGMCWQLYEDLRDARIAFFAATMR